ncbi:MAG: phage tail tape measure protein [Proteobacteria bacterium]|nr:phage tail tape measure protein [Pseudomonadota bacterium]
MSGALNLVVNLIGSDKLTGMFRNFIGTGKTAKQVMKDMAREASGLERELKDVRRELASASGNITDLVSRERELQRQLERSNTELAKQKRLLEIDATADAIRARGDALKDAGRDNVVEGLGLLAPILLATKAAGDFSSGMVDIQQKANLTNRETAQMRVNLMLAARAAGQMPEDMRAAVDVLAGKGLDPRQAALMVPAIGRLGTAFKVDLADGASAAFANLNNLKVPINQTTEALDIMAASGNAGAFEIRDMARHFPALTAQMQAMGESGLSAVGNLSAALQIAEKGTGNADQAANNIQNLLAKINSPGTIKAFQKNFGVDLPAAMAKLKAQGIDTFEAIAIITQKATKGDLKKLGFGFEDMQAQGAIRSLIQNLDEYRRVRDESMKAKGTVSGAFDTRMLNDANVSWTALKSGISELAITLGTTFLPVAVTTLGYINRAAGSVAAWAREHPQAAALIIQLVAGLAVFKIALGGIQFALGGLFGPLATAYKFFARLFPAGIMASRAMGLLVNGAMMFGRAMLFVGRALLLNPIGLLVTGVAVAGYLIWKHWDKIKGAFRSGIGYLGQAWAWMKGNARNMLEFSGPIGRAALFIWDNWATIKRAFGSGLSYVMGLGGRFVSAGRAIIDGLVSGIQAAPGRIWAALKSIIGGAWQKSKEFLGIASPSRLFTIMGDHISQGLAIGINRGGRNAVGSMRRVAGGVVAAGALSLSPAMAGGPIQPAARSPLGAATAAAPMHVEIHVHARDGQSAREIAKEVMNEIEKLKGVKKRSDFGDDE